MSAPDPEGISLLTKVLIAGTAVVTPVWGFFKLWNKKADKHAVANQLQEVENEQAIHRGYFKDVFEKMEEHARRDEDHFERIERASEERHRELLMHILAKRNP